MGSGYLMRYQESMATMGPTTQRHVERLAGDLFRRAPGTAGSDPAQPGRTRSALADVVDGRRVDQLALSGRYAG